MGGVHGNAPNILEVMFILSSKSNNCCFLYFNANIMGSFTKNTSASGGLRDPDPLLGLRPWTQLGNFCPPDPQSSFTSPNNPVRSTPLVPHTIRVGRGFLESRRVIVRKRCEEL